MKNNISSLLGKNEFYSENNQYLMRIIKITAQLNEFTL